MPRHIGLVIQGPLLSRGRTGAEPNDLTRCVDFDALDTIRQTVNDARNAAFGPIVLSTWEGERGVELIRGVDRLLVLPDPQTPFAIDNRTRQTLGCLEGVRALGSVDYVARVRTD